MFFYISGIASSYYNTESKGFTLFFWDKILRLIIPFFVAIFIFLIPRLYLGQSYEGWTRPYKDRPVEVDNIEEDYWTF
jgi:fucose 4-O-acetylase-like acetyltransferase